VKSFKNFIESSESNVLEDFLNVLRSSSRNGWSKQAYLKVEKAIQLKISNLSELFSNYKKSNPKSISIFLSNIKLFLDKEIKNTNFKTFLLFIDLIIENNVDTYFYQWLDDMDSSKNKHFNQWLDSINSSETNIEPFNYYEIFEDFIKEFLQSIIVATDF